MADEIPRFSSAMLRRLLREHSDGLTFVEIGELLNLDHRSKLSIRTMIDRMPDAYIDRWRLVGKFEYIPVWCVVVPPENCPKPKEL